MKVLYTSILLLFFTPFFAQKTKSILLENTTKINSIEPSDTNYNDFSAIEKLIGNHRLVMLGEQDHGDADTFKAKTRLVQYLHEKLGFNVIAFESDFYGIQRAWDKLDSAGIDPVFRNVYAMWTGCLEAAPLFDYIRAQQHETPIKVAGIDCRHTMNRFYQPGMHKAEMSILFETIGDKLTKHDSISRFWEVYDEIIKMEYRSQANQADQQLYVSLLKLALAQIETIEFTEKSFWRQELKNTLAFATNAWDTNWVDEIEIRDNQMADNLLWLMNKKYPNEKIIVWASNSHNAKNHIEFERSTGLEEFHFKMMGSTVNEKLNGNLISIGFTSYNGKGGRVTVPNDFDIPAPENDGYEKWIHEHGYLYAFTNLQDERLKDAQFITKIFQHKESAGKWHHLYDGIFYVEQMHPCTPK